MEFAYIAALLIWSIIWGFATKAVIDNKGYEDNWFWWGFFFGFIAFIIALTKPDNHTQQYVTRTSSLSSIPSLGDLSENERILRQGGWKCSCGRVNASYTSLCACGKTRGDVLSKMKPAVNAPNLSVHSTSSPEPNQETGRSHEIDNIELIKKYKELLDIGAITEEEYQTKKAKLLAE